MKFKTILIIFSVGIFACTGKNQQIEKLKLTTEIISTSIYSKSDSSFFSCHRITPDSSIIIGVKATIENLTDSTITFTSLSCSYYFDFKVHNQGLFICGHPCWANFPEKIEIAPKESLDRILQIIDTTSLNLKNENLMLSFNPDKTLSKENRRIDSLWSEISF
jgi:hypothetical protein